MSIDTYEGSEPTEDQIRLIQELPGDYDYYMEIFYDCLKETFVKLSLEAIKQMYFLAAIELKHNDDLWFTLEPGFDVSSIYNHFQRFRIANKTIIG